jgi:RHS repeat-associated protein
MRLYQSVTGGTTLRLAYDGLDRIAEYDGSNALQRRYVHGPSMDEPLVQYEGSVTTDRRFMSSDERGSIISLTDNSGTLLGINRYDEFGNPQTTNIGTFGYTGQAWLPGVNLWYYKARHYDPELGRFLQTDPIDVEGGINLYAYVGNDPINWIDPLGLAPCLAPSSDPGGCSLILVGGAGGGFGDSPTGGAQVGAPGSNKKPIAGLNTDADIVVRGKRSKKGKRASRTLSVCEIGIAGALLSNEDMSFDLGKVVFKSGLDNDANLLTRNAFNSPDTWAVTQFNTVYVKPSHWGDVTNPRGAVFWEEVAHTAQFQTLGYAFYASYGQSAVRSYSKGGNGYELNDLEDQAKGWAERMANVYKIQPCAS